MGQRVNQGQRRLAFRQVVAKAPGVINPEDVRAAITDKTTLIAVHHVNHDIGTIAPIREIGRIAVERGIAFYVDAEASAGWLPVDVQEMGVNLLSFSPHRFYGPKGVGALYVRKGTDLIPHLTGERTNAPHQTLFWRGEGPGGNYAARQGNWKLVRLGRNGAWELYDLKADRTEQHNLADARPAEWE